MFSMQYVVCKFSKVDSFPLEFRIMLDVVAQLSYYKLKLLFRCNIMKCIKILQLLCLYIIEKYVLVMVL